VFNRYKIKKVNNEDCLFLYMDNNYEFSIELFNKKIVKKQVKKNIYTEVIEFINSRKIKFNGKKIFLILNGMIVGTIVLHTITAPINLNQKNMQYVHHNSTYFENKIPEVKNNMDETNDIVIEEKKQNNIIVKEKELYNEKNVITNIQPKTNISREIQAVTPIIENIIPSGEEAKEKVVEEIITSEILVTLHRSNGLIEQIALEDYVIGVVASEMPALFHLEALKAQSLAARTYVLKRIAENKIITDTNMHQIYKDETQLKSMWGSNYNVYFNKIKNAVDSTKGEYISYNYYYIDALYHSTSNGKTEDPIYVWGGSFPYLKSVNSHWDLNASTYTRTVSRTFEEATKLLGFEFNGNTNIQVVSTTVSDRIDRINIGEHTYSGVDIRTLFGLRSSDFDIEITNDKISFTTRGFGHGVGMSQYGANGMANEGYNYRQILNHYYPNTRILNK